MECIEEEIYMTKRLLNANVSDIVNFSNEELKQSIKANEGRTVLSENVVIHEPLIQTSQILRLQNLLERILFF